MKKIKLDGLVYELHQDTRRYYDYYWHKGIYYEHAPVDTEIIGYVLQEKQVIGICKISYVKYMPIVYTAIGALCCCVFALGVFVFTRKYSVVKWDGFAPQDNVIGELDDGLVMASKRFTYSQYASYDGVNVSLFYDTDELVDVALKIDSTQTEFVPAATGFKIPVTLNLEQEDICGATLLIRKGETIDEYPIIIERLIVPEVVELTLGDESDRIEAQQKYEDSVIQQGKAEEATDVKDSTLSIAPKTDDGVDVDFDNFEVITYKKEIDDE